MGRHGRTVAPGIIENRVHSVPDVNFDEDRSRIRRLAGARTMSCLCNLAIGLLRMAGVMNIAAAVRYCQRNAGEALRLIGS